MEPDRKCPFCGRLFTNLAIRKHIGVVHLNLTIEHFKDTFQVKQENSQKETQFDDLTLNSKFN